MAIRPITGMLRRHIIFDLSVGIGIGFVMGNVWWYGFHVPRVKQRDALYLRLEGEREATRRERAAAAAAAPA